MGGLGKGATFTKTINELAVTGTSGIYEWDVWLVTSDPTTSNNAPDLEVAETLPVNKFYVLQAGSDPLLPDVSFKSNAPTGGYEAATKQTIEFVFTAGSTPIRKGNVSFELPPAGTTGWTAPHTGDGDGKITVQTDQDAANTGSAPAAYDKKYVTTSGQTITVKLDELPKGGRVIVTYTNGMVQRTAGEVKIASHFLSGGSLPRRVSNVEEITITNVADGTGTATITPDNVEAGSNDNTLTVTFKTEGSMDTGRVRLTAPADWGAFQDTEDDPAKDRNYVRRVTSSAGSKNVTDVTIDNDTVTAHLGTFGYGHTLTFVIESVVAQRQLGVGELHDRVRWQP